MARDVPQHWVNILIDGLLWPEHPLGRDVAGNKESVAAITREMMLDYLAGQYQPSNTVVAIAGNIQHREIVNTVGQVLGGWSNRQEPAGYSAYKEQAVQRLCIETRDIEQAHFSLALPGLSLVNPKRFTLDLLNVILGEGMSSRLFAEIRDKLGLAYSIHSYVDHLLDTGSILVYAGVEPGKLPVAIEAVLGQLSQLKEKIPESEIAKAKELSKGRLLLRMEDSRNVAGWVGGQEILTGRILSLEQVVSIIDAITAEELKQIAEELLIGSQLRLAVVGPIAAGEPLEELLEL
jgi:predicted Zn-dependent peptidase